MVDTPVLHLKEHLADLHALADGIAVRELASDHLPDDLIFGDVLCRREVGDGLTVTQDGDRIGDIADLVQLVRDHDAGDAVRLQGLEQVQQVFAVLLVEGSRGLVQNKNFTILTQRLGDLHELLLADADLVDGRIGIFVQTDALQKRDGGGADLVPVDDAVFAQRFADEHVLGDGELRDHSQLLMDDGDTGSLRLGDALKAAHLAVYDDVASVAAVGVDAGQDVHQRGFARAVLAHQRLDLASLYLKRDVIQRLYTRKFFGDASHLQDIILHLLISSKDAQSAAHRGRCSAACAAVYSVTAGLCRRSRSYVSRSLRRRCRSRRPRGTARCPYRSDTDHRCWRERPSRRCCRWWWKRAPCRRTRH